MALGVLNNISAVYAENNLNQTQSSLQKTLQQLSSGSRINSGADDAAGLSLADGLQANATALTQSAQNAGEGIDFLQVADGALSQVSNLLNRAVTLATEASNGTLNSSQQSAADAEYQKILTEIDTINNTTEYNGINTFAVNAAYTVADAKDTIAIGTGSADTTDFVKVKLAGGSTITIGNNGATTATAQLSSTPTLASLASAINVAAGSTVASVNGNQLVLGGGATLASGSTTLTETDAINSNESVLQLGSSSDTFTTTASQFSIKYNGVTSNIAAIAGSSMSQLVSAINTAVGSQVASASGNQVVLSGGADFVSGGSLTETDSANTSNTAANSSVAIFTSDGSIATIYDNASGDLVTASTKQLQLGGTSLTSTANAQAALSDVTTAIATVASDRGTLGANINTLTAVENVMTTQSTNTQSAQNDVTATDYGAASSNLSKYEILMQTGISALAQANSTEQMVTKLLQ